MVARNDQLVELVSKCIGETASRVYAELLRKLEKDIKCCNLATEDSGELDDCN